MTTLQVVRSAGARKRGDSARTDRGREPLILLSSSSPLSWSRVFSERSTDVVSGDGSGPRRRSLLVATYRKFPWTPLAYRLAFLLSLLLVIGAHYQYAQVPIGLRVKEQLSRLHDRQLRRLG